MDADPLWRFYPTIRIGKSEHKIPVSPIHGSETSKLLRVTFHECSELKNVWIAREFDIDICNACFDAFWKLVNEMTVVFPNFETVEEVRLIAQLLDYFNITSKTITDTINEKIVNFASPKEGIEFRNAAIDFIIPKLKKCLDYKHSDKFDLNDHFVDEYVDLLTILSECTDESMVRIYLLRLLRPTTDDIIGHRTYIFTGILGYLLNHLSDDKKAVIEPFRTMLDGFDTYCVILGGYPQFREEISEFGRPYI